MLDINLESQIENVQTELDGFEYETAFPLNGSPRKLRTPNEVQEIRKCNCMEGVLYAANRLSLYLGEEMLLFHFLTRFLSEIPAIFAKI